MTSVRVDHNDIVFYINHTMEHLETFPVQVTNTVIILHGTSLEEVTGYLDRDLNGGLMSDGRLSIAGAGQVASGTHIQGFDGVTDEDINSIFGLAYDIEGLSMNKLSVNHSAELFAQLLPIACGVGTPRCAQEDGEEVNILVRTGIHQMSSFCTIHINKYKCIMLLFMKKNELVFHPHQLSFF